MGFQIDLFQHLLIALACGLIIGIERGWANRASPEGTRTAGVRTFAATALIGGLVSLLPEDARLLAPAVLLALAWLVVTAYRADTRRTGDFGITTEVALFAAFVLGYFATRHALEAVATATLLAVLLGLKREMHRSLAALDRTEFVATLQLLIVAAVVLPLLPNEAMGPWQAINPRAIGWLVLLILGLSYTGYFAVRLAGTRRGLILTALLGGLSSSTAVTLAYARMARQPAAPVRLLASGIIVACTTMAPRVGLQVLVIEPALLPAIALPVAALGLVPLGFVLFGTRSPEGAQVDKELVIRNPLALGAALGLAATLTVLGVAIRAATELAGSAGVLVLAALSGILGVDAVTVTLAREAGGGLGLRTAAQAILIAAVINTIAKALLAGLTGGQQVARIVMPALLLAALAAVGLVVIGS
jgi:uncharacterized membrane protein (DUF4010 family)